MQPLRLALALASLAACGPKADAADETTTGGATTTSTGATIGGSTLLVTATDVLETTGGASCPDPNSALSNGQCFCRDGYAWCNPDDPDDLSCCEGAPTATSPGPTTTLDSTSSVTTDEGTTGETPCGTPPPTRCDPVVDTTYCDSGPACELGDSVFYTCEAGLWQPAPAAADAACQQQGHDFAFGCVQAAPALLVCGVGPGTDCAADDPGFCTDMNVVQSCVYGRLADTDCPAVCKAGELDGVAHDGGYCVQSRISSHCECCDAPNCP